MDRPEKLPECCCCGTKVMIVEKWAFPWPLPVLEPWVLLLLCPGCGQIGMLDTRHGLLHWSLEDDEHGHAL